MRAIKRWKYYCEFCRKSGGHRGIMERHEKHCTLNPNRECGMCKMLEQDQPKLADLIALLPSVSDDPIILSQEIFDAVQDALPKLREAAGNCPACMMAAFRQRHIPVPAVDGFDFSKECKAIWAEINQQNREHYDAWNV